MIICVCHRVSDRDIARQVQAGCSSFEQLQAELAVATGCGACHGCAQASFHELRQQALVAVPVTAAAAPQGVPVRMLRRLRPAQDYSAGAAA